MSEKINMFIWDEHLQVEILEVELTIGYLWWYQSRAVENAESARSVIYAIFSAHSAYFNVSRQKVPYFNVSRQNRVVFKTVLQQNNVEAC